MTTLNLLLRLKLFSFGHFRSAKANCNDLLVRHPRHFDQVDGNPTRLNSCHISHLASNKKFLTLIVLVPTNPKPKIFSDTYLF